MIPACIECGEQAARCECPEGPHGEPRESWEVAFAGHSIVGSLPLDVRLILALVPVDHWQVRIRGRVVREVRVRRSGHVPAAALDRAGFRPIDPRGDVVAWTPTTH